MKCGNALHEVNGGIIMSINFNKNTGNEIKSSAHSKYRCQYHIVFAPKYRRKEIYGQLRKDIGEILRKLCAQKGVEIIEAEACPDHIHMLIKYSTAYKRSTVYGISQGKKYFDDIRQTRELKI